MKDAVRGVGVVVAAFSAFCAHAAEAAHTEAETDEAPAIKFDAGADLRIRQEIMDQDRKSVV